MKCSLYLYVCMYVCMYVCIYVYTHDVHVCVHISVSAPPPNYQLLPLPLCHAIPSQIIVTCES